MENGVYVLFIYVYRLHVKGMHNMEGETDTGSNDGIAAGRLRGFQRFLGRAVACCSPLPPMVGFQEEGLRATWYYVEIPCWIRVFLHFTGNCSP